MPKNIEIKPYIEKAVLVGIINQEQDEDKVTEYLDELAFLIKTAGANTVMKFTQRVDNPNPKTLIGSGKLAEIKTFVEEEEIDIEREKHYTALGELYAYSRGVQTETEEAEE